MQKRSARHSSSTSLTRRNVLRLAYAAVPAAAAVALPRLVGTAAAASYIKPDWSNTGIPVGTNLTVHRGDIVVTTPGTVIDSMDVYGYIKVRAANVTIRRTRVRGTGTVAFNTALIDCNHSAVSNAVIEDCLLVPDSPSVWVDGVIGKEFTARWNNVYNTCDGFGVYNAQNWAGACNVTIESNFIHDLVFFSKDPNHSNGTHNDGIQIQGGSNVNILGNNILMFYSRGKGTLDYASRAGGNGILVGANLASVTASQITNNWLNGGIDGMYILRGKSSSMRFGSVSGNRFGRDQFGFSGGASTYQIRVQSGVTFNNALTANYWQNSGLPLAVSRTGGIRYDY
ncbi:hypothetical protein [Nakamurella sp. PAMC28650]|uniref:hypothetical protein n=1 Tax=Nakamurella sp. PAMC28650 TaxID=2762325 RepID=UPI00164E9446|nr:hypothetical protein [Nakamurella sp. PAMC28650]QNK80970.1 hypothetical protein H7F38_23285 [Nakamurella sp. PAMC28650]